MKLKRILKLKQQIDSNLNRAISEDLELSVLQYENLLSLRSNDSAKEINMTYEEARKLKSTLNQLLGD